MGIILSSIKDKGKSLYSFELKNTKIFHMKNFYKFLYQYMIEEGYRTAGIEDQSDTYPETFYDEWVLPNGYMERRIWWRFYYNPETHARFGTQYRYYIDLNFRNLWLKDTETVIQGKKIKAQKGEIGIIVKAYFKFISEDEIKKHPILQYFYYFWRRRWIKYIYEGYRDDLRAKMRKLQDAIKEFMDTATYEDDQKSFHKKRGIDLQ